VAFVKINLLELGNIAKSPQFTQIDYRRWATKVVETLSENDVFRYLSTSSTLFASSVNSLIPLERRGRGEEKVPRVLENRLLLPSVSTFLSHVVAWN